MSVFVDISAALSGHLETMVGLPPVSGENFEYAPVLGTLYIRETLLPAGSTQATLGDSGLDMNLGIYQIDVFAQAGEGKKAALEMADTIANHFKRGTDLTYNGRVVTITKVSRQVAANSAEGWYQIPLDVSYKSFTQARI